MKRLWRRTTPLQSTCTLRPWASILCLQTVLLQGNKSCCLRFQWNGWNPLFSEHMPTSSLISLNKPKKMPTRFEQVMIKYMYKMYSEHSNSTKSGSQLKHLSKGLSSIWGRILPSWKVQVIISTYIDIWNYLTNDKFG